MVAAKLVEARSSRNAKSRRQSEAKQTPTVIRDRRGFSFACGKRPAHRDSRCVARNATSQVNDFGNAGRLESDRDVKLSLFRAAGPGMYSFGETMCEFGPSGLPPT